jgi:hypothetical protein
VGRGLGAPFRAPPRRHQVERLGEEGGGRPEDLAPCKLHGARGVLFLVAEDAGFITGATLSINGGKYLA